MPYTKPISLVYVENDLDARKRFRDEIEIHISNPVTYIDSGEEFQARIARHELADPGIVLVDLQLPDMSGFQVVRGVREQHKHLDRTPLIVVTGEGDAGLVQEAKKSGADAYIEKPVTVFSLMHVLKRLGRYELQIMDRRPIPELVAKAQVTAQQQSTT
jgi:FixJ family two-component response regulator